MFCGFSPELLTEVGVDDRKPWKIPRLGVGEELRDRDDAGMVADRIAEKHVAGRGEARVVVAPRDVVGVQTVEDRPLGSGQEVLRQARHPPCPPRWPPADSGGSAASGPRWGEPAIRQREGGGQRVGPRQVLAGPITHRDRAARRLHESIVAAAIELHMGLFPLLGRLTRQLAGRRHPKCMLNTAARDGICRRRPAIRADRKTVSPRLLTRTPAQHPEIVVVGVILHHQNQEMVDLGQRIRAFGPVRKGPLARAPASGACCVCSQFPHPS